MRRDSIVHLMCAPVLAVVLPCAFITVDGAEDRTLEEFKQYAATRAAAFSEVQLDALARGVDKDGNGIITDEEFAARMEVFQRIASGVTPPTKNVDMDETVVRDAAKVRDLTNTGTAMVLLVTADELAAAWESYAEWKTRQGKATKIITVQQIAKSYEADNIQEQIRLCVRDHIDNHGTRWVVLGGDSLPGGKGLVPGGHLTVHRQERAGIPTDIVYLSETNWDADGDGVYGEWDDDRAAISYPDGSVGLGRVPVRTAQDVSAFTDKVIAYESRYPETKFAKQMIYTCTDSPAYPKVRNSWDSYVSEAWDGTVGRFFSQETPWDKEGEPGSYPLSAENLVGLFNGRSTGKMHIHGHGHLPAWVLERSTFTADHVGQLENIGAYPLITTVSCNTGEYDSRRDPSIVELMIRKPKGGSVAIVAPVRTGKMHFANPADMQLMVSEGKLDGTTLSMTRYWEHGLGQGVTTGEAMMHSKADMAEDAVKSASYHLCICELNLLGDPTLDMRASDPRTPSIKAPTQVTAGKQIVQIATDAPGCTVCLWKDDEVYSVVQTGENGNAELSIEPTTAGDLLITVSGPSLNTVAATIKVQSGE
ncbi:MAG: C25 family cysteine peptidase [Pirellulales bacterium]|nr:C25 family cysteine peptidase [Pirellulales bacterium]